MTFEQCRYPFIVMNSHLIIFCKLNNLFVFVFVFIFACVIIFMPVWYDIARTCTLCVMHQYLIIYRQINRLNWIELFDDKGKQCEKTCMFAFQCIKHIHSFSNFWISNIVWFLGVCFLIHGYLYLWLHCDSNMSLVTCRWCETFPSARCVYNIPLGPQTVNREPGPTRRWISMHNVCIRHTRQHYTSALHYTPRRVTLQVAITWIWYSDYCNEASFRYRSG